MGTIGEGWSPTHRCLINTGRTVNLIDFDKTKFGKLNTVEAETDEQSPHSAIAQCNIDKKSRLTGFVRTGSLREMHV
jgi:hypothetical protein